MPPKSAAKTRRPRRSKKPGVTISDAIRLLTEEHGPFANEPRLDPAHELTFTILSQHTSDRNSERAFRSLMHRFGDLYAVAAADVDEIEQAIAGGGLAKVKAPRIKTVLNQILELNDGSLDLQFLAEMPMNDARAWLRQLPGIGPKSAGIILSFSLGMPAMAVDTHIYRVSQRLGFIGPKVNADKGPRESGGRHASRRRVPVSRRFDYPRTPGVQGPAPPLRRVRGQLRLPGPRRKSNPTSGGRG